MKTFIVRFEGSISYSELEDTIYQGLQFYEDIEWKAYSVVETTANTTEEA